MTTKKFRFWIPGIGFESNCLPAQQTALFIAADGEIWACSKERGFETARGDIIAIPSTGFKDADGKEIFEGDIVLYSPVPKIKYITQWLSPAETAGCKIIGNIWENPVGGVKLKN